MRLLVKPGNYLDFTPVTLELYPDSTIEHVISLLTLRYPDLDATKLSVFLNHNLLPQDKTLYDLNIQDDSELSVTEIQKTCCSLL
jgi:hypothetical protein